MVVSGGVPVLVMRRGCSLQAMVVVGGSFQCAVVEGSGEGS